MESFPSAEGKKKDTVMQTLVDYITRRHFMAPGDTARLYEKGNEMRELNNPACVGQ